MLGTCEICGAEDVYLHECEADQTDDNGEIEVIYMCDQCYERD